MPEREETWHHSLGRTALPNVLSNLVPRCINQSKLEKVQIFPTISQQSQHKIELQPAPHTASPKASSSQGQNGWMSVHKQDMLGCACKHHLHTKQPYLSHPVSCRRRGGLVEREQSNGGHQNDHHINLSFLEGILDVPVRSGCKVSLINKMIQNHNESDIN